MGDNHFTKGSCLSSMLCEDFPDLVLTFFMFSFLSLDCNLTSSSPSFRTRDADDDDYDNEMARLNIMNGRRG